MLPLIGGLISGGASLLGSFFGNQQSAQNVQNQIAGQEAMQKEAEQYNTQMSNTAYQRASQDMQAAGLNPAMMFGSGSAASSPAIGPQQVPLSQQRGALSGIGEAAEKALSAAVSAKMMDKMTDEMANLETTNSLLKASTATEVQRARQIGNLAGIAGFGVTTAQADAERAKRYLDMPYWLKDSVEYAQYGAGGVSSIGNALSSWIPTARGVRGLLMNPDDPTKKYTGLGPSGTQTVKDMIDDAFRATARRE